MNYTQLYEKGQLGYFVTYLHQLVQQEAPANQSVVSTCHCGGKTPDLTNGYTVIYFETAFVSHHAESSNIIQTTVTLTCYNTEPCEEFIHTHLHVFFYTQL